MKKKIPLYQAFLIFLSLPIIYYTLELVFDFLIITLKVGWSPPSLFISLEGILIYIIYTLPVTFGLILAWQSNRSKIVGIFAVVISTMLLFYWIGLLTHSIGVTLPNPV